ncbi:MAG: hypothetical protein ABJP08_28860 [Roseibium sp.]
MREHELDDQMELFPKEVQQSKPWAIVVVVLALVLTLGAMFYTTFAQAKEPTEERLKFFIEYAGDFLGVYTNKVEPPRIVYISSENIQLEYYGAENMAKLEGKTNISYPTVNAIYQEGTLILNKDVDYTLPENEGTLVHEMVHHVIFVKDLVGGYPCLRATEDVAYRAENLWAMATGIGRPVDALSRFLHSQCPRTSRY